MKNQIQSPLEYCSNVKGLNPSISSEMKAAAQGILPAADDRYSKLLQNTDYDLTVKENGTPLSLTVTALSEDQESTLNSLSTLYNKKGIPHTQEKIDNTLTALKVVPTVNNLKNMQKLLPKR